MQRNGFKIILILFFIGISVFYLYPSVQNIFLQRQLTQLEGEERENFERANFQRIQSTQERALKLGLDLQGGMHVVLEVRVDALIHELAVDRDETFEQVLRAANERSLQQNISVIDAFVQEFERRDPDARLSRYFRNPDAGVTRRSTNAEIARYLQREADAAVERAISIVRDRVDRFGVTEPSIQRQGARRIVVELPGVDDPERVRRLLRGTARLEFRTMADPEDLLRSLQNIIEYYEQDPNAATAAAPQTAEADTLETTEADTLAAAELAQADPADQPILLPEDEPVTQTNRLLEVMQPEGRGVVFGMVAVTDTAAVSRLLEDPNVQNMLPANVELLYTSSSVGQTVDGRDVFYLLGVREEIELTGEVITDARVDFDEMGRPQVTMVMNSEGARTWARVTGANINRNVAIVLDGVVYSYPTVQGRITGGRSSITGLGVGAEGRAVATDIVTILKSGALPAPVDIVEERTVGPSLGAASIRAGFRSVMVGLMLVALFMIFYYRTAGAVANLALLLNIIFILGILAGFQATLTLPGIAGIVLTIGMAVDANVLIFDRIREEMNTGKTLKAAIETGYAKALSAILDANITTFFVGAILYSFGVGPIQGFAVTLMAGILASMFSAIIITRVVFDYMVLDRRVNVSYG
jgi:SecD/SecF fusion protein